MIPMLQGFRHSLAGRLLLTLGASLILGLAVLFVGIDHSVSRPFSRLRADQLAQSEAEVRRFIDHEGKRLESFAALLAQDADLRNGVFYHLFLAGERTHPEAAIARIAAAFAFESVSLWDGEGRLIAAVPATPPRSETGFPSAFHHLTESEGRAWLIAEAPILREAEPIAQLRLARPLERVLAEGLPLLFPSALRIVPANAQEATEVGADGTAEGGTRPIALGAVTLLLALPDPVGAALAEAKRVLAIILLGGGLLFGLFLAWQVRRQTEPLAQLAHAAQAVGRGDFTPRVPAAGAREIAELAEAFNRMAEDLALLRQRERQRAHQEQLSAIGRVAARVAHDINNPLTVIGNTAQLALKNPPPDERLVDDLRRIVHHTERCRRTLELLLDYGRPVRLSCADFDLAAFLRELGARWQAEVSAPSRLMIHADRLQLEQMLDNLLANAREASPLHGKIALSLRREGPWVEIAVRDDGPGFTPEASARLGEPFFTTKAGGTGLGLASALAIARAHGGELELGAGPGGCVIVRLPA